MGFSTQTKELSQLLKELFSYLGLHLLCGSIEQYNSTDGDKEHK